MFPCFLIYIRFLFKWRRQWYSCLLQWEQKEQCQKIHPINSRHGALCSEFHDLTTPLIIEQGTFDFVSVKVEMKVKISILKHAGNRRNFSKGTVPSNLWVLTIGFPHRQGPLVTEVPEAFRIACRNHRYVLVEKIWWRIFWQTNFKDIPAFIDKSTEVTAP